MDWLTAILDLLTAGGAAGEAKAAGTWNWGAFWTLVGMIVAVGGLVIVPVVWLDLPDTHPRLAGTMLVGGGVAFIAGLAVVARRVSGRAS